MKRRKLKNNVGEIRVFIGRVDGTMYSYDRLAIRYVKMLDKSGTKVEHYVGQHILTAKKPFEGLKLYPGAPVRFTGRAKKYRRADGSWDYEIVVNKARVITESEFHSLFLLAVYILLKLIYNYYINNKRSYI